MKEEIKEKLQKYEDEGYVFGLYSTWVIVLKRTPNTVTNEHMDAKVNYANRLEVIDVVHRSHLNNHIERFTCDGIVYKIGEIAISDDFDYEHGICFFNSYVDAIKFLPFWFNITNVFHDIIYK